MLKPDRDVGIVGYGAYVPRYRLPAAEVARVWTDGAGGLPIKEKAVAGLDEDTITMSIEAARNALARAGIDPQELRAVWVGSESHPYAVKPSSTIVAEAIGATPARAGRRPGVRVQGGQRGDRHGHRHRRLGHGPLCAGDRHGHGAGPARRRAGIHGGVGRRGLHRRPGRGERRGLRGDAVARHRHAGLLAPGLRALSQPRPPLHRRAGLFRAHHQRRAQADGRDGHDSRRITPMRSSISPTPNSRSARPRCWASRRSRSRPGCWCPVIGNTYAGSSLIGLTAILDEAKPGDRILMVSFGSGAGSDAFSIRVTDRIAERARPGAADAGLHRAAHGDRLRDLRALPAQAADEVGRRFKVEGAHSLDLQP